MTVTSFMDGLGKSSRNGLLIGGLLVVAGLAASLWWLFSPRYQLLFGDLPESDAAEVSKSLTAWKVPYRFTDGGSGIEVPKDVVYDTRMKLVSAGVPSGGHVGFELFNDSDFGVTEFAQRVNYQRALQGELERSISALPGVEKVRVHLTIRRPGLFVGQTDASKASVALTMTPGELLTPQQVGGVRNLVSSAVEGLEPSAVVVLGPSGVMAGGAVGGSAQNELLGQNEEQSGYEAHVRDRVSDLLSQVFHLRSYRVSVDARMNFDQMRRVSEKLISQGNDGNGLLVHKRTSHSGKPATTAQADVAPVQDQDELDYAHGTEREETSSAPGKVERLSIAVLVPPTLNSQEMERLRKLVIAAAGLELQRGDRLEIGAIAGETAAQPEVNDPLMGPTPTTAPVALHDQGLFGRPLWIWLALMAIGGLALGWTAAAVQRPSLPRLRVEERDAVLLRLRSWLAEGESA